MGPSHEEFNPAEYPPEYITVGIMESLPSILDRVEDAWVRTPNAVLVVPRGAQAFHSTHDFLALGKLQDAREVRVSVASRDPIIQGLARLLGFHTYDLPEGYPEIDDEDTPGLGDEQRDTEKPTAPLALGTGLIETPQGWVVAPSPGQFPPPTTTSTWLGNVTDYAEHPMPMAPPQPGWTTGLAGPPAPRQGVPAPRTRPRQTGYIGPGTLTGALPAEQGYGETISPPPIPTTETGSMKVRRVTARGEAYRDGRGLRYGVRLSAARWGRWAVVAAIVLAFLLVSGSAYAYVYLPEGTVEVTPLSKMVTGLQVEVAVRTSGPEVQRSDSTEAQSGPPLTAAKLSVPVSEEGTRAASGTRDVAKGRAQGFMRFTNRTGNAVSVPAGTQFKAANGVAVQISQGGTVPPTVFGASFGNLDLPIVALVDGPDGNIGAGQAAGVWNGTLNYSNSAMQGGSIETLKVVTQEDIDALVGELRAKAEGRAASVVIAQVGAGQALITQTISLANATYVADRKPGEDGDAVGVKLTAEAQAYTYREADMHDSVAQAVLDSVQSNNPKAVAPSLDLGSIQYAPVTVASNEGGQVVYQTQAAGRVTFALTNELAAQIRDLVKGKARSQARTLIYQNFGSYINPDSIEARVLWFTLDTLPGDPTRISVESSRGATFEPSSPLPGRQTTPDPRSQP